VRRFPYLPAVVDTVEIPRLLSPTSLSKALECCLSAALTATVRPGERLPPDPKAILGTVFHQLVECAVNGQLDTGPDSSAAIRTTLNRLLCEKERYLASTDLAHYVPLSETITFLEFLDRRARAIANAKRHLASRRPSASAMDVAMPVGAERPIVSEPLRLTGRIDLLELENGEVIIRDLKTGNVRDANGAITQHISFQMRLYGLLARAIFPDKRIRLVVEHDQSEEIAFDADEIERADEERRQLLERLPPGPAEAANLANVGIHCRWCDVRHLCSRYRSEAPRLWSIPRNDYALPLDLWGAIADRPQSSASGEFSLRIRDDAGRQVAIVALDQRHGPWAEMGLGQRLWFFGLQPRGELRNAANQYSQPTNFRELKTAAGEKRAYQLRVFLQESNTTH
jgi:hypothetical protein